MVPWNKPKEPIELTRLRNSIGYTAFNAALYSYDTRGYWLRTTEALRVIEQRLHKDRKDLLPQLTDGQLLSLVREVRYAWDSIGRYIKPIAIVTTESEEDKNKKRSTLTIKPIIGGMYGVKENDDIYFSSDKPYGIVKKKVAFDKEGVIGNDLKSLTVSLLDEDVKLIFGLPDVPKDSILRKYKITRISPPPEIRVPQTVEQMSSIK